jgi:hypothetical protein
MCSISNCFAFQDGWQKQQNAGVMDTTSISKLLSIATQLFEHMYDCQFWVIPDATAAFFTKQFGLLLSICFLCRLLSSPIIHDGAKSFKVTQADAILLWSLWGHQENSWPT